MKSLKSLQLSERAALTDQQLRSIGLVVSEWAKAEQTLFLAMTAVFGGPPGEQMGDSHSLAMLLGSGMDSRTMIGLLKGIVREAFPDDADEFDKLADDLAQEGKRRNAIAHGVWRKGKRPNSIRTMSIRSVGQIKLDEHEYTAAEMDRLAERTKAARGELVKFLLRHGYMRTSLPDKSSPPDP